MVLDATPGFTASFALHGLGGVGKTQIAIRYAYQWKTFFDVICWLQANDRDTLVASYVELSRSSDLAALGAPKFNKELESSRIAQQMKMWFEKEKKLKWLLIFDNADKIDEVGDIGSVVELIPRSESGCVLVTSRNRTVDGELAGAGCEVGEMKEGEAVQFLLKCSRQSGQEVVQDATDLVERLGYLPLAIE